MDYIGATPQANPLLGLLAERLKQAQEFAAKPFGYSNPPAEMLMNLLGVPAVQQTAERLAYGEPLTTGRGMTTQIRPEAVEAALTVAPAVGLLGKGTERAAMAAGRAGERYAEKVVPQIMERGGLPAQLLGDLSQGSIRPMDVWHGSPHGPFTKFDPTKIGSGEGAQAFSYGHYLGEARGTGEEYARQLAGKGLSPVGEQAFAVLQSDVHPLIKQKALSNLPKEAIEEAKNAKSYLYKVDLPDEAIANMLDWDKPYNKQPKQVQDALKNSNIAEIWKAQYGFDIEKNQPQMDMVYKAVAEQLGSPAAASQYFKDLGILGTRYLDEGSRAAGKGTSNFVVFPGGEDLLTIKEINDKPVGGLLGQSKAAFTYPQEEAMRLAQQRAALPISEGGLGLKPNNTAAERAAAMEFNESGYTGTAADITRFDPSKAGSLGSGSREGPLGTWLTDDPRVASSFADWSARGQGGNVVYPLKIMGNPAELNTYSELKDIVDANTKFNRAPYRMMQDKVDYDAARKQLDSMGDYVAMRNINTDAIDEPITQYLVTDPDKLRSIFAAFDPWRRTSAIAAAMGVAAPDLLAEEQKPKKKKNLLD